MTLPSLQPQESCNAVTLACRRLLPDLVDSSQRSKVSTTIDDAATTMLQRMIEPQSSQNHYRDVAVDGACWSIVDAAYPSATSPVDTNFATILLSLDPSPLTSMASQVPEHRQHHCGPTIAAAIGGCDGDQRPGPVSSTSKYCLIERRNFSDELNLNCIMFFRVILIRNVNLEIF